MGKSLNFMQNREKNKPIEARRQKKNYFVMFSITLIFLVLCLNLISAVDFENYTKYEWMENSGDTYSSVGGAGKKMQIFTVGGTGTNESFTIKGITADMYIYGTPTGNIFINISTVNSSDVPDTYLGGEEFSTTGIPTYSSHGQFNMSFENQSIVLTAGQRYAFILSYPSGDGTHQVGYYFRAGNDSYSAGKLRNSNDGTTWADQGHDVRFQVYGEAYSVPAPEILTMDIISPTNITYASFTTNFELNITSDNGGDISCLYSLTGGVVNYTMTNSTPRNFSAVNTTMTEGTHKVDFYCNDSNLNVTTDSVSFRILDIANPISSCGSLTNANTQYNLLNNINYSASYGQYCINVTAENITFDLNGHTIEGNDCGSSCVGIHANSGANGFLVYNGTLEDFDDGIRFWIGTNKTARDIILYGMSDEGVDLYQQTNSLLYNLNISSAGQHGFQIYENSDNNVLQDIYFNGNVGNDLNLQSSSTDMILINASTDNFGIQGGTSFYNQWYYQAYVNDSDGVDVDNVNITAYNSSGGFEFTTTTNSTGSTDKQAITEYYRSASETTYYSNYTIIATNGTFSANHSYNVSLELNNLDDYFTLEIFESTPPTITIASPTNITYNATNIIDLNVSANEEIDTWWYSNDSGATNKTFTPNQTYIWEYGNHILFVWANDTTGNIGEQNVSFTVVDITSPVITITSPIEANNYNINYTDLNWSVDDAESCWYSLDSGTNTSISTNITLTGLSEGSHNLRVYCNDSFNNIGEDLVNWNVDTLNPSVNIVYPTNTTYTYDVTNLNYTAINGGALESCWYSIDGGVTNSSPQSCGTNWTGVSSSEGANTWIVWANDSAGNEGSDSVTFYKDSIDPVAYTGGSGGSGTTPINNSYSNQTSHNITVNASDDSGIDNATLYIVNESGDIINETFIDTGDETSGIWGLIFDFIFDGVYQWWFEVYDTIGNLFVTSNSTITIDTNNPNVAIYNTTNNWAYDFPHNITVNYEINDTNMGNCWYAIDNATVGNESGGISRYEWMEEAGSTFSSINGTEKKLQTFTVGATGTNENFTLTEISIEMYRFGSAMGDFYINISTVNSSDEPDTYLGGVAGNTSALKAYSEHGWFNVSFANVSINLTKGTKYAFILSYPSGDATHQVGFYFRGTNDSYSAGKLRSSNDGTTWTDQNYDARFRIFGEVAGISADDLTGDINCSATSAQVPMFEASPHNITLFAEDLANNTYSSTSSFFMENHEYIQEVDDNITVDGDVSVFELNVTMSNLSETTAYLIYNGTEYSATDYSIRENSYVFTYELTIPENIGNETGRFTNWSWMYSIEDYVVNFTTDIEQQLVYTFEIDDCNTYNDLILNLTLKDEETNTLMNESLNPIIEIDLAIISKQDPSISWTFNKTYNNITAKVCIPEGILNYSEYKIDFTVGYEADNYVKEFYYMDNGTLDNTNYFNSYTTHDIDLMDLLSTDSTTFLFDFINDDGLEVDDAIIHTYRKYIGDGIFREIERSKQDETGETHIHLVEEDEIYYFVVTQYGEIIYTSSTYNAKCLSLPCSISLEATSDASEFDTDWDLIANGSYNIDVDEDTREVSLLFSLDEVAEMNLTVWEYESNGEGFESTPVVTDTLTATSGTVDVTVPQSYGNVTFYATIHKDGGFIDSEWVNLEERGLDYFGGTMGALLSALIVLVFILMASTEGVALVIFTIVGLIFTSLLKLLELDWLSFISITVAGLIIVWKLTRRRR